MDLMFKRYSSPFAFLDALILSGKFSQGISEIWDYSNEDKVWDFYLHKVYGKSFDEFKNETFAEPREITVTDFETTVNKSKSMLQGFNPNESGGCTNGII